MDLFDFLLLGIALINLIACPIVALCLAASARQNRALHERNAAQAAMIGRLEWRVKNPEVMDASEWEPETREFEPIRIRPFFEAEHADVSQNYAGHRIGEVRADCPTCSIKIRKDFDEESG